MLATATPETLTVLHQDDSVVAVSKPAGLLVHRSPIDARETRFALQLVRNQLRRTLFPVHRLDKPTSGVLLFALSSDAARSLAKAFERGEVRKTYLAVVRGVLPAHGSIDYGLREDKDLPGSLAAREDKPPQAARTDYERLAEVELPFATRRHPTSRYSLATASPLNGRNHQIRRHFKHIFHPIVGDTTFGDGSHNRLFREHLGCSRMLLHAARLVFPHPQTGTLLTIVAPIEGQFNEVVKRLGWLGRIEPA
jgi:tRNA pseudouridine65 synthase